MPNPAVYPTLTAVNPGGARNDLLVPYGVAYWQPFVLAAVIDITGFTLVFSVRDKFRGALLLQKTTPASGVVITAGALAQFQVQLSAADLTNWLVPPSGLTATAIDCGRYTYDLSRTDAGAETLWSYGDFRVVPTARTT